ncbi:DUF2487 family protein [Sporosarcina pasteurii]|uniref:Protein of uncharacterized function (DUF2487) n=1 Tax=Sporosarcina pasteurii TaxID=1474 RepID=A0A380BKF9_SPOPA|nr:DUF2487 family protein [Sporosarcina pasteurii]MDS9470831.1 DUF2487 family protein [Sporosarcina pasteurii]QBQ05502.1 DUF2487 family protein [Sporosarcina pasteurii]SUJ02742.1 Protein of uncharacterised function (DUF2487) [Sporosarcina pasteurii]
MNWNSQDMDTYFQQKDYIDTLLVPLLKLETVPEALKGSSSATEFLMHLSNFIETQFRGRMMVLPPFTYTQSTNLQEMGNVLSKDLQLMDFKHIFYLTTDRAWTDVDIEGEMIWLPSIPLESMDQQLRKTVIEDQLRQVLPLLTNKWTE